jgi:hypothetical protein
VRPFYQPRVTDEYGAVNRMRIGRGNRNTRTKGKLVIVLLLPVLGSGWEVGV